MCKKKIQSICILVVNFSNIPYKPVCTLCLLLVFYPFSVVAQQQERSAGHMMTDRYHSALYFAPSIGRSFLQHSEYDDGFGFALGFGYLINSYGISIELGAAKVAQFTLKNQSFDSTYLDLNTRYLNVKKWYRFANRLSIGAGLGIAQWRSRSVLEDITVGHDRGETLQLDMLGNIYLSRVVSLQINYRRYFDIDSESVDSLNLGVQLFIPFGSARR